MTLLVKKFGGTSVGTIERIEQVAQKVIADRQRNKDIIVVLSAMAGTTDSLIDTARTISDTPDAVSYDMLVATGEQVSIALLAMMLNQKGCSAKAYTGAQVAIQTDAVHTKARIEHIETQRMRQDIQNGLVVIVAGFQGVTRTGDITTLGRGGSDTTAVAIAAAMQATECQIYTDVKGVYTCDPRVVSNARKLEQITCEEMMELAGAGAKVLQIRSVNFANKYQVPLRVLSSFGTQDTRGTLIAFKEGGAMEKAVVSAISLDRDEAQITISGISDVPGIAATLIGSVSANNIVVDMIVQNTSHDNKADFTFTVHRNDYKQALKIIQAVADDMGATSVAGDDTIAKLSVVGIGMRSNAGVANTMFSTLAKENINILMISTSEIKISVVVHEDYIELAARALHRAFALDYVEEED